jgi:hypothetical protein
MRENS